MATGVSLTCRDCGHRRLLDPQDAVYLTQVRSFLAAHQLCAQHSVVVEILLPGRHASRVPV